MMYENENYSNGYYQTSQATPEMKLNEQATFAVQNKKKKGKASRFFQKVGICAAMGACFGLCAGAGLYAVDQATGALDGLRAVVTKESTVIAGSDTTTTTTGGEGQVVNTTSITTVDSDITKVVDQVMPSMVSIINNYTETISYFGQTMSQDQTASGSGIIVGESDTELLIATNYHVVEDATTLSVNFIDNTNAEATLKGSDADMDLAVIAIPLSNLSETTLNAISIAQLGDSDSLQLGEPVIAIGNALGYGQSVTNGIVSALNREVSISNGSTGTFIQTNAAINPGNSGGALLNINGEVIGINSNKIGGTTIEGMGYAIPISAAEPILSELMSKETRSKVADSDVGYIGIRLQTVTDEVSQLYGFPIGVYVSIVEDNTPASAAGLLRGDIITKFDGNKITSAENLKDTLLYYQVGETVDIVVQRSVNGEYEEITLQLTLAAQPTNN